MCLFIFQEEEEEEEEEEEVLIIHISQLLWIYLEK